MSKIRAYVYKNYQTLVGVGMGITFGLSMVPQTIGLDRYKKIVASYSQDGVKIDPVDEIYEELKNKITARLELRETEASNLELFTCVGVEVLQSGSTKLRTRAIIGLPASFGFNEHSDVMQSPLLVGQDQKAVDWNSPAGKLLLESLILSKEAKAFLLARQIVMSSDYSIWTNGILRSLMLYGWYLSARTLNTRLHLEGRMKLWARVIIYTTIGLLSLCAYLTLADTYSCIRDNRADKKAAKLNAVYARGGVEYYEKKLNRNRAFKALTQDQMYTSSGNVRRVWRRPHVEDSSRKYNLKKYLKEFEDMIKLQSDLDSKQEASL